MPRDPTASGYRMRAVEAEEQRSRGAEEQRSRGAEEQRSRGAEEQRSRGAEEQRSRGAEEQRSRESRGAEEQRSRGAEETRLLITNDASGTVLPFSLSPLQERNPPQPFDSDSDSDSDSERSLNPGVRSAPYGIGSGIGTGTIVQDVILRERLSAAAVEGSAVHGRFSPSHRSFDSAPGGLRSG